jgi:hypothetical protein
MSAEILPEPHHATDPAQIPQHTPRKYIRDRSLFRDNPAAKLGL